MASKSTATHKEPKGKLGEPAVAITVLGIPKARGNKSEMKKVADAVAAGVKPLLTNVQVDISDHSSVLLYPDEKPAQHAAEHKPRHSKKKQQEEVERVFAVAESWNGRADVSPPERCHGVAHDVYVMVSGGNGGSQIYSKHYEDRLADQIQNRLVRSARELFGKPLQH